VTSLVKLGRAAGVGGAVGGFTGALVGMGIPEYEAKRYEGAVKDGGILASVQCDDSTWVKRAKDILADAGGEGIASSKASSDVKEGTKPHDRHLAEHEREAQPESLRIKSEAEHRANVSYPGL
jgi:hypothetical protein